MPLEGLLKADDYDDDVKRIKNHHLVMLRHQVSSLHIPDNDSMVSTDEDKTSHKGEKKAHEIRVGDFIKAKRGHYSGKRSSRPKIHFLLVPNIGVSDDFSD